MCVYIYIYILCMYIIYIKYFCVLFSQVQTFPSLYPSLYLFSLSQLFNFPFLAAVGNFKFWHISDQWPDPSHLPLFYPVLTFSLSLCLPHLSFHLSQISLSFSLSRWLFSEARQHALCLWSTSSACFWGLHQSHNLYVLTNRGLVRQWCIGKLEIQSCIDIVAAQKVGIVTLQQGHSRTFCMLRPWQLQ